MPHHHSVLARASLGGLLVMLILSACGSSSSQSTSVAQSERQVTYAGTAGVTLAGSLIIPAHPQGTSVPAVVIIAGSGSIDRNGDEPSVGLITTMYQQIAVQLAQQGIASLRYDKRAVGASTSYPHPQDASHPTPAEVAAVQHFFAWSNYVDDALATLAFLQQQPGIDPARIALLGHSEGTYIAEQMEQMASAHPSPPATLVLLSAPGRTYDQLIRAQLANQLQRLQATDSVTTFVLGNYDAIVMGIKQNGQVPSAALSAIKANTQIPPAIARLVEGLFSSANVLFWQGAYQVDPTALIAQFMGPVLLLQGADDQNVSATIDTPLLAAALMRRTLDDHHIEIIPNASHSLKYVSNPTEPGFTGPIMPQALTTLRTWLALKLHLPKS